MPPSRRTLSVPAPDGALENRAPEDIQMLSAATVLRTRTAPFHHDTEAAYADFDLSERHSYELFLQAHLRAVTAAERALAGTPGLPAWRPRARFLRDDLDALGAPVPTPLPFPTSLDVGRAWGVLYVLEGSRIGSAILARGVREDLPRAYLTQSHGPGEWRGFRAALGTALAGDDLMLERAVIGATACFALFATAARSSTSWDPWGRVIAGKAVNGASGAGGARRFGASGELVGPRGCPSGSETPARRDVG